MRGFDPYLTFQKLEVFCTVAELGSVTRAADRLCIAQPVVTAHLRSMEARLGYPLVARAGRNIALTEAGERVYRWATEVITRTREIERELAGLEGGGAGNAVVATSMSIGSYALPPLIVDFYRQHPNGLVTVQISNPQAAVDATRIGGCDFAVILLTAKQDLDGLTAIPLWEEDLLLVCAPGSRWVKQPSRELDLHQVPFISTPRNLARRELEDTHLRKHGLENRRVVLELGHPEAMKHAVRQDIGLSFMLASSIRADVARGDLVVLDRPDLPMKIPSYVVYREDKRFSAFQAALLQFIRDAAPQNNALQVHLKS
ncbi:LysR family transcriptional regulator [Cupriavidus sp. SK-4]|uniref:LysR family transcriptional regulator n=1 Tax=Cupriavidus sp. SK-4 TaxID=574750 RepID=UPI00044E1832|nr:LysR family transcriptional regulator [Cupriavidus sp. SK-4]EYS97954.1 LysR family transcriptional regulator [Cupriavidus sp. SK-4]